VAERSVTIKILGDASKARQAFDDAGKSAGTFEGKVEGLGGKFSAFGGALAGALTGTVATQAIGFLKDGAQGAAEDAAAMGRLEQAVNNTGASYSDYSGQIDSTIKSSQALGFTDGETADALSLLTSLTGDAGEAQQRLATAQDLARGTGMDLQTAAKLLGRVTDENTSVLSRYGIQVEKGATAQDLLNTVDAKFGGQAAKYASSDAGKWEILTQQLGEVQESIGSALIPVLSALATVMLTTIIPAITSAIEFVGKLRDAFGEGGLGGALALLGQTLGPIAAQLLAWIGAQAPLIAAQLLSWGQAFLEWVAPQIPPLLAKLGELLAQLGVWIVGTGLPMLLQHLMEWGKAFVEWVAPQIPPLLLKLGELLVQLGAWIVGTALPELLAKTLEWGKAFIEWIGPQIPPMLAKLGELLAAVVGWLIGEAKEAIRGAAEAAWNAVKDAIENVTEAIKGAVESAWNAIKGVTETVWSAIQGVAETIWGAIQGIVETAIGAVQTTVETVMGTIQGVWETVWGTIKTVGETIWGEIKGIVETSIGAVQTTIETVMNTIKGIWETLWGAIQTAVDTAWNAGLGIIGIVATGIGAVKSTIEGAWEGITGAWQRIWDTITGAVETAKGVITGILDEIIDAANGVIDKINGFIGGVNSALEFSFGVGPFDMPGPIPDIPGMTLNVDAPDIPSIPRLAAGGIVTDPTLALVGESGPEAVIPLKRLGSAGRGDVNVNYYGPVTIQAEDRRQAERASQDIGWAVSAALRSRGVA